MLKIDEDWHETCCKAVEETKSLKTNKNLLDCWGSKSNYTLLAQEYFISSFQN